MASELTRRARGIRLLTCDVDGVLTDGRIYVTDDGRELKAFHALDGVGLKLLMRSASRSPSPAAMRQCHRARRLTLPAWSRRRTNSRLGRCAPSWAGAGACAHIGVLRRAGVFRCGLAVSVSTLQRQCVHARTTSRRVTGAAARSAKSAT
jgi:3-deoxy-D-manno-octulosonate 8-phosphate phosphatase (KDO 8-P phosphatase)